MKWKYIINLIWVVLFVTIPVQAQSNQGSLKIDAELNNTPFVNEKTLIEQETGLNKLFDTSIANLISQRKQEESISYLKDKALLFVSDIERTDVATQYAAVLFGPTKLAKDAEKDKVVLATQPTNAIDWRMWSVAGLGFVVMLGTLIYKIVGGKDV